MTTKQELAIQKTVENGGNVSQAMREAGYSETTINNPSNLTKSKGYRAILEESGLNEGLVVSALVQDIKDKPKNRVRELHLAADLLGMKKAPPLKNEIVGNVIVIKDFSKPDPNLS